MNFLTLGPSLLVTNTCSSAVTASWHSAFSLQKLPLVLVCELSHFSVCQCSFVFFLYLSVHQSKSKSPVVRFDSSFSLSICSRQSDCFDLSGLISAMVEPWPARHKNFCLDALHLWDECESPDFLICFLAFSPSLCMAFLFRRSLCFRSSTRLWTRSMSAWKSLEFAFRIRSVWPAPHQPQALP